MIRGNKILYLTIILLFLTSCSPSVISIDLGQGEEGIEQEVVSTSVPEPTPEPEPMPTESFIECGVDLDCFYEVLESCQESSLVYSQALDMMGAIITTTLHLEILGPMNGLCEFSVKSEKVEISFSEEAVQQLIAAGKTEEEIETQRLAMEESQSSTSFDEICTGNPEDLIQTLERWEQGQFSMEDWEPFTCEGKIFTSAQTASEPTESSPPTAEPQPATGGNLLANMSFEVDPKIAQPRWYVDSKNTDIRAAWTTEQARDGLYSFKVSSSKSGNNGFPGWFLVNPILIDEAVWHIVQVWAFTPDGANAFVSAEFIDENGNTISLQNSGCVELDSEIWTKVTFGITEAALSGVSSIRLGLQQCLLNTEGTLTTIYYDEVYLGTTPP